MLRGPANATKLAAAALAAAAAASVAYLFIPAYTEDSGGGEHHQTLVQHEGSWVLAVLAVPVVVAALPLIFSRPPRRGATMGAAAALIGFSLVTGFTIGPLYWPSALLLALAARAARGAAA
jgi:hypothetical protein